jgi:hypothetical protein
MSGPIEIVLIVAAVCYVLVRRIMGEPAQGKRLLILPVVLGLIGLSDISGDLKSQSMIAFLAVSVGISVVLGALRGLSVRIAERDGIAVVHYTWVTVVLWVVNIGAKFGANVAFSAIDPHAGSQASNSLMLTLGVGMLVEGLITLARAMHSGHQIIWDNGRGGRTRAMNGRRDRYGWDNDR